MTNLDLFLDALKKSEDYKRYATLTSEGELRYLSGDIPEFPRAYRKPDKDYPESTIFYLSEYTCSGKCKIGAPLDCIAKTSDCGTYHLRPEYSDIEEMMEKYKLTISLQDISDIVNMEVQRIIFRETNCLMCGTQRCDSSREFMEGCEKWRNWIK